MASCSRACSQVLVPCPTSVFVSGQRCWWWIRDGLCDMSLASRAACGGVAAALATATRALA